jgi:hypothetical protein
MSAYLASQQTYDYIASGLYDAATRHDSDEHSTVRDFLEVDKDATGETLEQNITSVVRHLYDLNRLALVTRYGDQWDSDDSFTPKIKYTASIKLAQFIQCIACVLYQCAEYLTHETDTYKHWHDLEYQLAYSYFAHSPDNLPTKWNL